MKRLTYEGNFCDIAMCDPGESSCPKCGCSSKMVWEKLKAYEDTGLSPEEVKRLKMEVPGNCRE